MGERLDWIDEHIPEICFYVAMGFLGSFMAGMIVLLLVSA